MAKLPSKVRTYRVKYLDNISGDQFWGRKHFRAMSREVILNQFHNWAKAQKGSEVYGLYLGLQGWWFPKGVAFLIETTATPSAIKAEVIRVATNYASHLKRVKSSEMLPGAFRMAGYDLSSFEDQQSLKEIEEALTKILAETKLVK